MRGTIGRGAGCVSDSVWRFMVVEKRRLRKRDMPGWGFSSIVRLLTYSRVRK